MSVGMSCGRGFRRVVAGSGGIKLVWICMERLK
jgi:hypothetical protein